jgi:hypothetical protein
MTMTTLTLEAEALLAQLRVGGNVAQPSANVGEFAYSTLARAFLSNAHGLCADVGLSDFRVYGALYSLRHGLELMLKCIVRNDLIDETLRAMMTPGVSFEDVCNKLKLKKLERTQLLVAICAMRNVLEDRIIHPDCYTKNVDAPSAARALRFARQNPDIERNRFAVVWTSTAFGHDLAELWTMAKPTVDSFAGDARRHAQEIGFPAPFTSRDLDPIVKLLGALDDGGDGFRYPSSLSGAWYAALPTLSLEALGRLIKRLESTCTVFESIREHCYSMATLGRPTPQYFG